MQLRVTFFSVFATLIAITTSQKCYGLDGTLLDDTFAPCNPTAKHSGCCATKRASGADICLDNGLCMSTTNEYIGMIWQNGCTDSTGKDIACPKMCPDVTNNFGGLNPVPAWNVQQCDYGKYCCRASNDRKSCCNNATAPKINTASVGAFLVQTSTTPTPSATLVSPSIEPSRAVATAVSTGTPLDLAPKDDICSKERRQTAIVGGTIGSIFGAIILGLIGAAIWLYKREKHQRKMKEHYQEQIAQTNSYRRTIASSAVSLMGTDRADTHEEMKMKSSEA